MRWSRTGLCIWRSWPGGSRRIWSAQFCLVPFHLLRWHCAWDASCWSASWVLRVAICAVLNHCAIWVTAATRLTCPQVWPVVGVFAAARTQVSWWTCGPPASSLSTSTAVHSEQLLSTRFPYMTIRDSWLSYLYCGCTCINHWFSLDNLIDSQAPRLHHSKTNSSI